MPRRPAHTSWPRSTTSHSSWSAARDGVLRAFYNVCRHRGTAVVEEPCGRAVRFQCPYHAWIYDLDGSLVRAKHTDDLDDFSLAEYGLAPVRLATWQGFVFVSLDPDAPPLLDWLGDLVPHLERFDFGGLRVAHTETYEVDVELEVPGRELQRVLPLPGDPPAAQQADAVRPRWRLRPGRAVAGRLDGARRRRGDDGARWRPPSRTPGDARHDRRSTTGGSTTTSSGRRPSCRSTRTTCSSTCSSQPVRATPGSSASGCSSPRRSPRPGSTRGRDRVLGPDQSPGLARLRAPAARDAIAELDRPAATPTRSPASTPSTSWRSTATPATASAAARTVRSRYDIPPPKDGAEAGDVPAMLLPRSAARAGARAKARR